MDDDDEPMTVARLMAKLIQLPMGARLEMFGQEDGSASINHVDEDGMIVGDPVWESE